MPPESTASTGPVATVQAMLRRDRVTQVERLLHRAASRRTSSPGATWAEALVDELDADGLAITRLRSGL